MTFWHALRNLFVRRREPAELEPPPTTTYSTTPSSLDGLDIVLSEIVPDALDAQAAGEATDYDVRSLGEPIDPVVRDKSQRRR